MTTAASCRVMELPGRKLPSGYPPIKPAFITEATPEKNQVSAGRSENFAPAGASGMV